MSEKSTVSSGEAQDSFEGKSPILTTPPEAQIEPVEPSNGSTSNEPDETPAVSPGETSKAENANEVYFVRIVGKTGEHARTIIQPFSLEEARRYADGFNNASGTAIAVVSPRGTAFGSPSLCALKRLEVVIVIDGVPQHTVYLEDPRKQFMREFNKAAMMNKTSVFARMPVDTRWLKEGGLS